MATALLTLATIYFSISLLISWAIMLSCRKRLDELEDGMRRISTVLMECVDKMEDSGK